MQYLLHLILFVTLSLFQVVNGSFTFKTDMTIGNIGDGEMEFSGDFTYDNVNYIFDGNSIAAKGESFVIQVPVTITFEDQTGFIKDYHITGTLGTNEVNIVGTIDDVPMMTIKGGYGNGVGLKPIEQQIVNGKLYCETDF